MAMSSESSAESDEPGLLSRLPHPDLLTFLSLAQKSHSNILEYSPRYDDDDRRKGGNAAVQVVYLANKSSNTSGLPSFAFKRHDLVQGLTHEARLKKIICELIIYESAIIRNHPNFARLEGISWSVTSASTESPNTPSITPVLGFRPSNRGNLADHFMNCNKEAFSLTQKLELCCDIGHALETLHSLNIAHGDLKPENVLVQEFANLTAQLIDFDGSSFGLTDSDLVWISGTKGWTDPELTRGNRTIRLWEAFKADIYSFGKLCAWVLFQRILNIDDLVKDAGRTSVQRCEFFDLKGAIDKARLVDSDGFQFPFNPSELQIVESMQDFFSRTFVGCRKRRCRDISEAMKLLEQILLSVKAADVAGESNRRPGLIESMKRKAFFCRHQLGLTTRPYRRSRYAITQVFLTYILRIKHDLSGKPPDQEFNFSEKQWVYRSAFETHGLRDLFMWLHMILAWSLILVMIACMVFFIEELARLGQDACHLQDSSERKYMCLGGLASSVLLGPYLVMVLIYVVGSVIKFSFSQIRRCQRPEMYTDNMIEMTEANVREIGSQVAHSIETPSSLKTLSKILTDGTDDIAQWDIVSSGHDILPQLGNRGNSCHLLPELIPISPLLCRLHYRVRCQVVDDLRQRLSCSECYQRAKNMLYTCALLGIGEARTTDICPRTPASLRQTLKRYLQADLGHWSSMPRLPFEVRNQIQEGRADLYTFDGMPAALHSVMTEILAKVNTGIHYRSTQILCATMGRLFALLGRHEEAALCFYTSLTHRSKPRWRTYDSFHLRMHDYARSPNGNMGVRRLRDQLLEAEHDLFLFSLVYELIILGQSEEAIQEMQAVRDIGVAPNGLYLERETGRSFTIIMHRVTDARNLLIGILLENGMLQEIEEMKQEYDLADTLGAQSLGQKPTPEQAFQCFLTTERVASMLYQRGRFDDAVRMQRRLLAVCSQKLIHRTTADIRLLRQALALSLSRCENMVCVEEASTIQDELMERTLGEGKEPLFSLRLNQVHTLARLGRLGADCDLIRCLLQDDHERKIVVLESCVSGQSQFGASFFWLHELSDGLRTASIVQLALLATCVHLQDQAQLRLITLLGTNPSTSSVLNNFEELICFLKDATLQSNASVLHHLMLWDRLVCLLLYIGTVWEQREKFDLAQQASEDMTNYVSIMSEDPEDEIRAAHLRSLVSRAKAHYLNTTSSYAAADADFWNNALKAHRMAQKEGQNNGKGVMTADSLFKVSLAAMLKEKVIAFGDSDEVKELLDLYEDIDTKQDDLLAVRVEHAHITSALNLTNQDNYPHDDDPLRSALAECETTLGPSHSFTNQTRTRLAYSLERHGHFSEARNLLWEVAEHVKTTFGSDHPQTLRARFNFLKLQSTRAVELGLHEYSYLPGLSGLRYSAAKVFGKEHPTTQEYLGAYALALERDERAITEAIATKREVVRALNETLGVEHARTIQEESELAGMLCRRGGEDHSEGRVHFECSLRSAAAFYGVSHPRTWALWRECVSAVIASTSGDEVAALPKRTALSFNADSEPVHYDQNDHMVSALDPGAREILLSHFLLGADHPLTTEMQQRQSNPTQQYARTAPSNEETAAKFFPIPPTKQLKEQWSEFLEPLRKIYEKQRVYGLSTRREALELGKNRFQASGGFRLKYQNV